MRFDHVRGIPRAIAVLAALLVAGCSGTSVATTPPSQAVATPAGSTVVASTVPSVAPSPSENISGQEITVSLPDWANVPPDVLADFTAKTGVKATINVAGFGAIHDKVAVAGAANTAYADVTEFDWTWTGQFASAGWYEPLDGVIDPTILADIPQRVILQLRRAALRGLLQQRLPDRCVQHRPVCEGWHRGSPDDLRRAADRPPGVEEQGHQQGAPHDRPVGLRGHLKRLVPGDDGHGRKPVRRCRQAGVQRPDLAGVQGVRLHGQRVQGGPHRAWRHLA